MPTPSKSSTRRRSYASPSSSIIMVMRFMAFLMAPLVLLSCLVVTVSSSCTQFDKDSLLYSFGILMLELITGRRPLDTCKTKMPLEQVLWMQQMRSEGKQDQVFDPLLRGKGFEEEMLQVFDVGCTCVSQIPFKRPSIKEIVDWLKNVGSGKQHQNED